MYGQKPKRKKQPSKQTETKTALNSATAQLTGEKKTKLTGQSRTQAVQRRNKMELSGQKSFLEWSTESSLSHCSDDVAEYEWRCLQICFRYRNIG